ncbi:MAG: hypothetical protein JWL95_1423 [Gemmatimonadetes bacterium]|nr:hypothetical protein [Gemmatimonadota bacterium]
MIARTVRLRVARVCRVRSSRVSAVAMARVASVAGMSMSGVADVTRVPEMRESTNRHRRQPSAAEREAETIKVHT